MTHAALAGFDDWLATHRVRMKHVKRLFKHRPNRHIIKVEHRADGRRYELHATKGWRSYNKDKVQ